MKKVFINLVLFSVVMTVMAISGFDQNEYQEKVLSSKDVTLVHVGR